MNALDQYLELYQSHRQLIDSHAPEALNRPREAAWRYLKSLGRLPGKGDEGYPKISLDEMFAPDYGLNLSRVPVAAGEASAFSCAIPPAGSISALVVNDTYVPVEGRERLMPDGLEVMSLARAAELYPELVAPDKSHVTNPVAALNALFVQDGVFIRVRRGVQCPRPVQILSLYNATVPMMGVRKIRIVVEDGASLDVLACDHPRQAGVPTLSCRVVEATVGEGASLDFYDLEEATADTSRASVFTCEQGAGSRLNVCSVYVNGGRTRNEYYPRHAGERCETRLSGMVIGGGSQIIDNSSYIDHVYPRCHSSQLFKYAMFDSAQGSFEGMVRVDEKAPFTEACQTNRNLLASPDARMYGMPQLEIYCDEVKASHGSATGQLDENALFYMRSRGIPEAEARMMLIHAFMADVLDNIKLEPLRERLRHLLDKRLRGCGSRCDNCSIESLRK